MIPDDFYRSWKKKVNAICAGDTFVAEAEAFAAGLGMLYDACFIDGDPIRDAAEMTQTWGRREAFPEARTVVEALAGRYRLAVGSNSDHNPLMADLSRNRLRFTHIYSSESLRVYKPDVRFFRRMLERLSVEPGEAVYIGDSQTDDLLGAAQAGIRTIWINRKNERLAAGIPAPVHECGNLEGVLKWLEERDEKHGRPCGR